MKNIFLSTFCLLVVFSCKKQVGTHQTAVQDSLKTEKKFTVDSISVSDSVKISEFLTLSYKNAALTFSSLKDKALMDSVYAPLKIRAEEYTKESVGEALKKDKENFYTETKKSLSDWTPDFKQTWSKNADMKVFSNRNGFLTIRYKGDGFTGGAHGYYYEYYKTFDLQKQKTVHLKDILTSQDAEIWNRILMDSFLNNDLDRGQSQMLLVKEIPLTENFYFDAENLYFLYNQYEITAYAAGTVLIKVPFSEVKPFLSDYLKTRLSL